MPPEARCVAHVAVVTGNVDRQFAAKELYDFAQFLQKKQVLECTN